MQQILCKIIEKRGGIKKMRYFAKKLRRAGTVELGL